MEKKFRLLLLLVLLMTAATGAWAQDAKHLITATYREQTRSLEQPLPYATTIGELYEAVSGQSFSDLISSMSSVGMPLTGITSRNTSIVSIGEFNGASTPVTVIADGETIINLIFGSYVQGIPVSATSPLYAYMKDGVKDADKWTVKVGDGQAQALPIGGLKGDGSETVTLQYNGRLKVKGVKATSDAAPAKPAATVTTAPTGAAIVGVGKTTALVSGGEAEGGTLMYQMTTTNTKPTSTDGFSDEVPTAEDITASGTVYVWYYVKGDDTHSDSEIAGPVSVTVTPALSLTSPAKGQVIGSDGKNYAAAATLPTGVTKVAMIAYVSGSNGLAIALADEGSLNWATAKSTCEAKTPAFTGGTWHLPTQAEWNQMFSANGGDEERYTGLNTKINTAGGTALLMGGTGYWSSTPNGSNAWYVWLMDGDTDWRSNNVNIGRQVRACLAF